MAVLSVSEVFSGRSRKVAKDWTRTYTRTFRVITDNSHDGGQEVTYAVPIVFGSIYTNGFSGFGGVGAYTATEYDGGAFANEFNAEPDGADDGKSWLVTVGYGPFDPQQFPENPLLKPLEIEGGFNPYEEVVDEDQTGKAVVNSASDPFDPPITEEDPRQVLTIVRNEPSFDWATAYQYRNAVSSDEFWGAAPGQAKVVRISAKRAWDQYLAANSITPGGFFWIVTYEFEFNIKGWHRFVLDQGMRKLSGGNQSLIVLLDGTSVTSPVLLDGNGGVLAASAEPVFLEFITKPELPFAIFNLENPGP